MIAPVKIGDVINIGIIRFGKNGDPVIKYKNFIIFLKNLNGKGVPIKQMIKIKIIRVFKNYAFAEWER